MRFLPVLCPNWKEGEWYARANIMDESTQRNGTTTLVGWATFIRCLMSGRLGLCGSPGTRGSQWGPERTRQGVIKCSSFTPLFQILQRPAAGRPPCPELHRAGICYLQIPLQPSKDELVFTCWWAWRSPTRSNCASHTHCKEDLTCIQGEVCTHALTVTVC